MNSTNEPQQYSIMSKAFSILLVGIGGYGNTYVEAIMERRNDGIGTPIRLAGVVDPLAEKATGYQNLKALGVPFFKNLEDFFSREEAGLAVISSPIHLHASQMQTCLEKGAHVLCEKPLCATVQDARRLIAARNASGRSVAIGYQLSFAEGTQKLKKDIRAGIFGAPRRFRSACCWPRSYSYYGRNPWAGRQKNNNGDWVLDGPVNNA
ncbi:MAG: Gfo/Idh/MocA family oxidoreductase, partial [Planctomycetes bacterium]|nr:Gfo/Idh/MocA family oxidoreductase [Planctomycetota bacterium]